MGAAPHQQFRGGGRCRTSRILPRHVVPRPPVGGDHHVESAQRVEVHDGDGAVVEPTDARGAACVGPVGVDPLQIGVGQHDHVTHAVHGQRESAPVGFHDGHHRQIGRRPTAQHRTEVTHRHHVAAQVERAQARHVRAEHRCVLRRRGYHLHEVLHGQAEPRAVDLDKAVRAAAPGHDRTADFDAISSANRLAAAARFCCAAATAPAAASAVAASPSAAPMSVTSDCA